MLARLRAGQYLGQVGGESEWSSVRAYQLYLKGHGNSWEWVGTLDAATHRDAFRAALMCLGPGDEDRPIRIEQDTEGAYRKPFRRGRFATE